MARATDGYRRRTIMGEYPQEAESWPIFTALLDQFTEYSKAVSHFLSRVVITLITGRSLLASKPPLLNENPRSGAESDALQIAT